MSEYIELFFIKNKIIKKFLLSEAVDKLYYSKENDCRLPTQEELNKAKSKNTLTDIKYKLSINEDVMPLYDVFTSNIYLIQKRNVYTRVVHDNYRFPDKLILDEIKLVQEERLKKIKLKPELINDKVFMRKIDKIVLMLEFMNCFDNNKLFDTYINIFYRYAPELANGTYTCLRKSFMPHKNHLKPYYTRDEVIKLGMNIGIVVIPKNINYNDFKDTLSIEKYQELCTDIQKNDISASILVEHQNYIIKNNMVGIIQYYTLQGSYFMNQYMRGFTKYSYKNEYLENIIKYMWDSVINAPAFDKDYILYRFVDTDNHLKHLNIGDIYIEKGFTSTTRDPFYRTDLYKFGFILIKIRIPKNIVGVGLCLETLSHFPSEEEIILAPLCNLKLISKDIQCEYYNPDEEFVSNVKTRYEFVWIKNSNQVFPKRENFKQETNLIDFLELKTNRSISLKDKINNFFNTLCDPMNRIKCKIGDNTFYAVAEYYDSSDVYKQMYALKLTDGFSLYSIYDGYILFMIEIGEENGYEQMHVNYFTKYSQLRRNDIMGDDNFVKFIASMAHYFNISNVILYADYISCDNTKHMSKHTLSRQIKKYTNIITPINNNILNNIFNQTLKLKIEPNIINENVKLKKQRTFVKSINEIKSDIINIKNESNVRFDVLDDLYSGGSYCVDYYIYLKHNVKRYSDTINLNAELQPKFSYVDIDLLKTTSPDVILKKNDRDEVYQFYNKNYKLETNKEKHNIAEFYIWMIENKCYLIDIFVSKLDRIYKNNNPFKTDYYVLDISSYLYNRNLISVYNRFIKMNIDIDHTLSNLPKNRYTVRR